MFDKFCTHVNLPRSFLAYFVTLIPKVDSPLHLEGSSYCTSWALYKLVVKVLAGRLTPIIDEIIYVN
jgi:hypothetical protein